jgi:hypothetical protein
MKAWRCLHGPGDNAGGEAIAPCLSPARADEDSTGYAPYQRTQVRMMSFSPWVALKLTIIALPHSIPGLIEDDHTPWGSRMKIGDGSVKLGEPGERNAGSARKHLLK